LILEYYMLRFGAYPIRDNPSDSGINVYYNPEEEVSVTIMPGENAILPTGVKFGIPHGYMLQIMNRSSFPSTRGLVVGANVVDAGYDGEIFVDLHNIGKSPQTIRPRDVIAQIVLTPVVHFRAHEVGDDNIYDERISIKSPYDDGSE